MRPGLSSWSARLLAAMVAVTLAGGGLVACSTIATTKPGAPTQPGANATIAAAEDLARQAAQLTGKARDDNAAQIARLLAGLDDATLAREAAALPAGDPLYNFAGRALLNRGLPLPRPFDRQGGFGAANRPPADRDGYRPPVKLAVLLPLSGELWRAPGPGGGAATACSPPTTAKRARARK